MYLVSSCTNQVLSRFDTTDLSDYLFVQKNDRKTYPPADEKQRINFVWTNGCLTAQRFMILPKSMGGGYLI